MSELLYFNFTRRECFTGWQPRALNSAFTTTMQRRFVNASQACISPMSARRCLALRETSNISAWKGILRESVQRTQQPNAMLCSFSQRRYQRQRPFLRPQKGQAIFILRDSGFRTSCYVCMQTWASHPWSTVTQPKCAHGTALLSVQWTLVRITGILGMAKLIFVQRNSDSSTMKFVSSLIYTCS